MDNIYWCATNVTHYRALKQVKDELGKNLDPNLKNKLEEKIKTTKKKPNQSNHPFWLMSTN